MYSMEIDKVAFGTQGHTQKESYRKWHLAIVMSLPIEDSIATDYIEQKSRNNSLNYFIRPDIFIYYISSLR